MAFEFTCKKCGSTKFKTLAEPQTLDDYLGAVCLDCRATVTSDDIKAEKLNLTGKLAREAFKTHRKTRPS